MAEMESASASREFTNHSADTLFKDLGLYELKTKFHQSGKCVTHRIPFTNDRTLKIRSGIRSETWRNVRQLGEGGFGVVKLQRREENKGQHIQALERAVKEIRFGSVSESIDPRREIDAMVTLSKNKSSFVQIEGWYRSDTHLYIAMEYFQLGDLRSCVPQPLPENEAKLITIQVTEAVKFMHEQNLVHRDLKPENILVAASGPAWWVKIADFGISKRFSEHTDCRTHLALGTHFAAPELVQLITDPVTTCADMWSVGCLVVWLVTMKNVFENTRQYCKFATGDVDLTAQRKSLEILLDDDGVDFVANTLCPSPADRLTAQNALKHSWLQDLSDHLTESSSTILSNSDYEDETESEKDKVPLAGDNSLGPHRSNDVTLVAASSAKDNDLTLMIAEIRAKEEEEEVREKQYLARERNERIRRTQRAYLKTRECLAEEAEVARQQRRKEEGPDLEAYEMFYTLVNGKRTLDRMRELKLGDFTERRASSPFMSALQETFDHLSVVSHQRAQSDSFYRQRNDHSYRLD